jgi:DNA-binding Xre family transcriptional regulator
MFYYARLYKALDDSRQEDKLSWRKLGEEMGISASTFTRMKDRRSVRTQTLSTILSYLGRPFEDFCA